MVSSLTSDLLSRFYTSEGSAFEFGLYQPVRDGRLIFKPGEVYKDVEIEIIKTDQKVANKTFSVTLNKIAVFAQVQLDLETRNQTHVIIDQPGKCGRASRGQHQWRIQGITLRYVEGTKAHRLTVCIPSIQLSIHLYHPLTRRSIPSTEPIHTIHTSIRNCNLSVHRFIHIPSTNPSTHNSRHDGRRLDTFTDRTLQ